MLSLLNSTPDALEERPPKSSLPWVWFGFVFVAAFIIEGTLMIALDLDEETGTAVLYLIAIVGWIYWLFCIHRFHKVLAEISRNQFETSPLEAVGKHFIPFFNFYWIVRWPAAISEYVNGRGKVRMISGYVLGVLLLISVLVGKLFDGSLGLAGNLIVGLYISAKLRRHIDQIAQTGPPKPNPAWFESSPPQSNVD